MGWEEGKTKGRASKHGDSVSNIKEAIKRGWGQVETVLDAEDGGPGLGEASRRWGARRASQVPPWMGLQAPHWSGRAIMTKSIWTTRRPFLLCCAFPVTSLCWGTVFPVIFQLRPLSPTVTNVRLRMGFSGTRLLPAGVCLHSLLSLALKALVQGCRALSVCDKVQLVCEFLGSLDSSGEGS